MDPVSVLSIVAASASIATAAGKAARQLDDLRVKYNEAPENLRILGTNLRTVEDIITNLHDKYDRSGIKLPERQLRLLDDNLYSCVLVITRLQVYLDKVQSSLGPIPSLTTRQKLRYMFSDTNIRQYQDQLFQQTQILNVYSQQIDGRLRTEDLDDALDDATTLVASVPDVDAIPPRLSLDNSATLNLPFNDSQGSFPETIKRKKRWYHSILRGDRCSRELIEAAQCGNVEWMRRLIGDGAKVNFKDKRGNTPLHHAAMSGKGDAISHLLLSGADPEMECKKLKITPLHISQGDATDILLQAGASPFASSIWKAQPLHIAVSQNNLPKVEALLSYAAPVDKRDKFGLTPLHIACIGGYTRVVKALLEAGADPNLHRYNHAKQFSTPQKANPPITPDLDFGTALCIASTESVIKALLEHKRADARFLPGPECGVDIDDATFLSEFPDWLDPLYNAIQLRCSPRVIRKLLERGAALGCDAYDEILAPARPLGGDSGPRWKYRDESYGPEIKRYLDRYAPSDVRAKYDMSTLRENEMSEGTGRNSNKEPASRRARKRRGKSEEVREQRRAASVSFRDGYTSAGFAADEFSSDEEDAVPPQPARHSKTRDKRHSSAEDSPSKNLKPPSGRRKQRYSDPLPALSEEMDDMSLNNASLPSHTWGSTIYCSLCAIYLPEMYVKCHDCGLSLCQTCSLAKPSNCPTRHKGVEQRRAWPDPPEQKRKVTRDIGIQKDLPTPSREYQDRYLKLPKSTRFDTELKPSDSVSQIGLGSRRSSRDLRRKSSRAYVRDEDRIYV